ncbi:MAG: hypothetical protein ACREOD_06750 [Candidatus Dormibacteria bacterium]
MVGLRRAMAVVVLSVLASALTAVIPALAAGTWWQQLAATPARLRAVASDPGGSPLALVGSGLGWYTPAKGRLVGVGLPRSAAAWGSPVAVASRSGLGVAAFSGGRVEEIRAGGGAPRRLGQLPAGATSLAVGAGSRPLVVATTSAGLFAARLGGRFRLVARGNATRVLAPPRAGLAWLALVDGRVLRLGGGRWRSLPGAPRLDHASDALAELGDGVVLAAEPSGLVWRGSGRAWAVAFQVLPVGGLGGVPRVTALVADGPSAAYLATDGFGTLLTPDGGYTWYRASPPVASVTGLAAVGPVFAPRARGYVLALGRGEVFRHQLQALPGPPSYRGGRHFSELAGTALVTAATCAVVLGLLWYRSRRRRALSV